MKLTQRSLCITSLVAVHAILSSTSALAAGFEKSVIWSGKYAPIGSAASSSVLGAEALYFNPAGLASGNDKKLEFTLNLSPIFGKFSGPITANNVTTDGSRSFVPSFSLFSSYQVTEKWGFGVGVYAAGGTKAIYENVNFGNVGGNPAAPAIANVEAELNVVEVSAGTGYEIIDGLRLGVAYRVVIVNASLASANPPGATSFLNVAIDDLSATRWNGFRVGLQYAPKESRWGLGADWRTQIGFTANGTASGNLVTAAGTTTALNIGPASVTNTFPQQVNIGGHLEFMSGQRLFLQYTFTEYHKDKVLEISSGTVVPVLVPKIPNIEQEWKNIHNVRVGYECNATDTWAFRAGYVLTTAATPKDYARATFSSPGTGHTFVLGAGKSLMDKALELNGGIEYSFASGTVTAEDNPATGILLGDYSSNNYAFHLGATYRL